MAAAAAGIAVGSKFVLRVGGKHLLNPTNGAIVALLALATALPALDLSVWVSPGQWGNTAFFLLLMGCLGTIVVTRAARADVTFAFLASWAGLLLLSRVGARRSDRDSSHRLQNGALLLFAFFMISDPKTTPDSRPGRVLFGVMVACGAYLRAVQAVPHQRPAVVAGRVSRSSFPSSTGCCRARAMRGPARRSLESAHETPPAVRRPAGAVRPAAF